jgi:poly(A) polymerase
MRQKENSLLSLPAFYPPLALVQNALGSSSGRVFLVGGALRDYFLARPGTDLDFAVDRGAVALSRRLARRINGAFVLLDREHGSARVVKKIDGKAWTFDLTDWRGTSIRKDLSLRDFTINALALDITGKKGRRPGLLELKGSRRDLTAGVVRMVNPRVFKDDPLRLLRAYALQAVLDFRIDRLTLAQIKRDAHLISAVAVERVREEIFKVLASSRAQETLARMDRAGLLSRVVPQITVMYGVKQGGYHHLDVWRHTLQVIGEMDKIAADFGLHARAGEYLQESIGGGHSRLSLLKMAALLHDIGKPECARREAGRMTFHGHEHAGQRIARQVARLLKLSVKERFFLEDAVRLHLRPGYLSNFKVPSEKAIFRYLRDSGREAASLAILALADQAATRGPLTTAAKHKHHAKICRMLIDRFFEQKDRKPRQRLLTGHDLIRVLKLKPSEVFGKILSAVEEAAALDKIKTKPEALALARKISQEASKK